MLIQTRDLLVLRDRLDQLDLSLARLAQAALQARQELLALSLDLQDLLARLALQEPPVPSPDRRVQLAQQAPRGLSQEQLVQLVRPAPPGQPAKPRARLALVERDQQAPQAAAPGPRAPQGPPDRLG